MELTIEAGSASIETDRLLIVTMLSYLALSQRMPRKMGHSVRDFEPLNLTKAPLRRQSVGSASG